MKEFQLKTLVKAIIREALSSVCSQCNGSGEGKYDGSKCNACNGSGSAGHRKPLTKQSDPDYDWDAEREEKKLSEFSGTSPLGMNRKDRRDLSKKLATTDTSKEDSDAKHAADRFLQKTNPSAAYKIGSERQRKDFLKSLGAKVENVGDVGQHLINGQSNAIAASRVNKILSAESKGLFSDNSWEAINNIFKKLSDAGLDVTVLSTKYGGQSDTGSNMPKFKEWQISIPFTNKNGKQSALVGVITAHGAGSVEQPLDRYDITAYVSPTSVKPS